MRLGYCLYNFCSMCASFLVFWLLNNSSLLQFLQPMLACIRGKHFLSEYRDRVKRVEFYPINWETCRRSIISFLSSVVEPAPGEKRAMKKKQPFPSSLLLLVT